MCVVRCDDGKIIQWNNAMAEVTQVAETDAIGKEFVADFLIHSARSGTEAQRFVEIMQLADSELKEINNKVREGLGDGEGVGMYLLWLKRVRGCDPTIYVLCIWRD